MNRYRARWVLPVTRPPIADGVVVERDGTIVYVGDEAGAPPGRDDDLGDVLLLPGLVNVHTHLELTAMRGFLEELEFQRWIHTLTHARRAVLSSEMLIDSARLGLVEGLRAGTTTFADTGQSGVSILAMRELGVRGVMYQEVFGPRSDQCERAISELRSKVEHLRAHETALVRLGVSPHAPYSVSDALFTATAGFARAEALPMAIHAAESEAEDLYVRDGAGPFAEMQREGDTVPGMRARSPIALLERAGALDARPLLIHCVRVDAQDIDIIAGARCSVAHCPASNAKLGHGVAPLLELLASGIPVGLGSDSVASNNRMNVLEEARLAALLQRSRLGRHDAISAATALRLSTLDGARALGLDQHIGSLDAGKAADLCAFDLRCARGSPVADPTAAAVFALSGCDATFVTVAGRVLVRHGHVTGEDRSLVRRVQEVADKLLAWRRLAS